MRELSKSSNVKSFEALEYSEEFKKLTQLAKRRINVFEVFDDALNENPLTRILRFFCDSDESHGLDERFLRQWIKAIDWNELSMPRGKCSVWARFGWKTQKGRYLDLLLEIRRHGDLAPISVIGVEAKIGAPESKLQVSDYQDAIVKRYPGCSKTILFLAPLGRSSQTGKAQHRCSLRSVSYRSIATACRNLKKEDGLSEPVRMMLDSLERYLTTNQAFGEDMEKQVSEYIKKLSRDPDTAEAINLIQDVHKPTVRSLMYERLLPQIREELDADIELKWCYPTTHSRPNEFNFLHAEVDGLLEQKSRVEFYYMLHSNASRPDKGSQMSAYLMGYDTLAKKNQLPELWKRRLDALRERLPNDEGDLKQWGPWICLWAGPTCRIGDLAKNGESLDPLVEIYIKTYKATASKLIKWLKSTV